MAAVRVTYVFDAYCGWCYGFGPAIRAFADANAETVDVKVLSGGLFRDDRALPLRDYPYIPQANVRIAQMTGVSFGEGYQQTLAAGDVVMDSMDAAVGLAALRSLAPDRALEFASAMQQSWYRDGASLSEPATYRAIAAERGLDPDAVERALHDPATKVAATADIRSVAELGVDGYPTLLVHTGTGVIRLGSPTSTGEQLTAAFLPLLTPTA